MVIDQDGAQTLVQEMVRAASWDVMHSPPGSRVRLDAEIFFRSDWFEKLTGLNGKQILQELQAEYDKKHPPKERRA